LSLELEDVIQININVDYIKSRPVRARIFACLCDVMGAKHTSLILYCELRWLSLGNVLKTNARFESRCYQYLTEVSYDSACMFNDGDFFMKLAYLSALFEKLNTLDIFLQGGESLFFRSMTS
jgi:hypothetical protein